MSKKVGDLLRDQARVLEQNRDIRNKIVEDCIISIKFKDETIHHTLPINQVIKNQLINDLLSYKENVTTSFIRKKLEQEISKIELNPDIKDKQIVDTLISLKFADNTTHHIFPPNTSIKEDLIEDLRSYSSNIKPVQPASTVKPPEKIVLHNRQAIGDILTMTCAIRDFKNTYPQTKIGVITTASHIWDHNPYIDHSYRDAADVLKIGPGYLTNKSNQWNYHMCNAFRLDIEQKTGLTINQGPTRPDIWLTEEEYHRAPLIDGPYWVIIVGGEPGWTAKTYPIERWQAIINALPEIKFVQLGMRNHPYKHLDNVIDYIGKTEDKNTGIRDLFNIFLHAQGSLGLVSMHMHLSAAFNNPCVVIAGAREPSWFTNYLGHQYIQTNGTMHCAESTACWKTSVEQGCKNKTETNLPKCVDIIQPEQVVEAIKYYYKGGRLEYGKKVPNTFFKNIAKVSKTFSAPPPPISIEQVKPGLPVDLKFGGGSITDRDWEFIQAVIEKNNVKTILEFGAGLSTILMSEKVTKIDTYETMSGWINKIKLLAKPTSTIRIWNGHDIKEPLSQYDFAFVDGPSGGGSREFSTKIASEHANIIIIHDAGREPERKWQKLYLENNFDMISKGGHRCHLWMRKDRPKEEVKQEPKVEISLPDGRPTARMITTCRGYGGSERSSLFIMKMLLDKGYYVDLVPTGNVSGEYGKNIPQGVIVKEWGDALLTPVDILVLYASDTIWNYDKPQYTDIMHKLQAKKKIMVLNYQLGGAGKVPWTLGWDKYMFLNSSHEAALIQRIPDAKTKVLAPPTDLEKFFEVKPNYDFPLKLIRHNSQGDAKHPIYTNDMITKVWEIDNTIEFFYMPARSDTLEDRLVHKYKRNEIPIPEFLSKGNCFWYHLPPNYTDGGPRVILEAFAAGLPAIVDNHSGPKDRVDNQTGWKCDNYNQYFEVIKEIIAHPELLIEKGTAAREKAKREFVPERWIEEILS